MNDPGALRALGRELREASDTKVLKVTRMIDMLADRGAADELLAPLRQRLAALRPPRPVTRRRLLFTPFDPILVSAASWRPSHLTLPRSIIPPVTALAIPDESVGEAGLIIPESDHAALTRAGAPIWKQAAAHLAETVVPAGWSTPEWQRETGLSAAVLTPLLPVLRLVLVQAPRVRSLTHALHPGRESSVAALLSSTLPEGIVAWGIMLALLIQMAPPDEVVRAALDLSRDKPTRTSLRDLIDQAAAEALERMQQQADFLARAPLADRDGVSQRIRLIERLEAFARLEQRPAEEQQQVARLRQSLSAASRAAFGRAMTERLRDAPAAEPPDDQSAGRVATLEEEARQLRRFAQTARRLGDGDKYEKLLREAAVACTGPSAEATLGEVDRLRLTELLLGSDKAIRAICAPGDALRRG